MFKKIISFIKVKNISIKKKDKLIIITSPSTNFNMYTYEFVENDKKNTYKNK